MKKCPRCKTWNKEPGLCVSCGHDLQTPFVERVPIYKRKWFFILCGYLAIVLVVAAYRQLRPTPPPAYTPPPTYTKPEIGMDFVQFRALCPMPPRDIRTLETARGKSDAYVFGDDAGACRGTYVFNDGILATISR